MGHIQAIDRTIHPSQFQKYETAIQCGLVSATTTFKANPFFEDWYIQRHPDAIPCNAGEGEV